MNEMWLINKYLNLLEASLVGTLHQDPAFDLWSSPVFNPAGRDWPAMAQTMIGTARMRNLRTACKTAILDGVRGDFIETGVIDDYFLAPCAQAVNDFRARHGITEPRLPIDGMGAFWRLWK